MEEEEEDDPAANLIAIREHFNDMARIEKKVEYLLPITTYLVNR